MRINILIKPCVIYGRSEKEYNSIKDYRFNSIHRKVYSETHNNYVFKKSDVVMHTCDKPGCEEPTHLFLGTQLDNINDCINKGRRVNNNGTRNGKSLLSEQAVLDIKQMINEGYTQREIAEEFNVSQPTISAIKNNKRWKILDGIAPR